jgi:hypothetical protein
MQHSYQQQHYQQQQHTMMLAGLPQAADAFPAAAAAAAGAVPDDDRLKSVRDSLPAAFHGVFSYRFFNPVQSETFDAAFGSDANMVSGRHTCLCWPGRQTPC